jgi:hypothetical protein
VFPGLSLYAALLVPRCGIAPRESGVSPSPDVHTRAAQAPATRGAGRTATPGSAVWRRPAQQPLAWSVSRDLASSIDMKPSESAYLTAATILGFLRRSCAVFPITPSLPA